MRENKKETLTNRVIIADLIRAHKSRSSSLEDWRMSLIIPMIPAAVIVGLLLESWIVGVLILTVPAYHVYRLAVLYQQLKKEQRAIRAGGFTVITDTLSRIDTETIYEPHSGRRSTHLTKTVTFFYFSSGQWRMPSFFRHYQWSKELCLSASGLLNTSVPGNEFYLVLVNGDSEIGYVYNKKLFTYNEPKDGKSS